MPSIPPATISRIHSAQRVGRCVRDLSPWRSPPPNNVHLHCDACHHVCGSGRTVRGAAAARTAYPMTIVRRLRDSRHIVLVFASVCDVANLRDHLFGRLLE